MNVEEDLELFEGIHNLLETSLSSGIGQVIPDLQPSKKKSQELIDKAIQSQINTIIKSHIQPSDNTVTLNNFVDILCQLDIFKYFNWDLEHYVNNQTRKDNTVQLQAIQNHQNKEINVMSQFINTFTKHFVLLHKNNEGKLHVQIVNEFINVIVDRQECVQILTCKFIQNIFGHLNQQDQITEEGLNNLIQLFKEFKEIINNNQSFNQFRDSAIKNQRSLKSQKKNNQVSQEGGTNKYKAKYQQAADKYHQKQKINHDNQQISKEKDKSSNRVQQLYEYNQIKIDKKKLVYQKQQITKLNEEKQLYKFQPKINKNSERIVEKLRNNQDLKGQQQQVQCNRLFEHGQQIKEQNIQKKNNNFIHKLNEETQQCTFTPNLVANRYNSKSNNNRNQSHVKGTEKTLERMKKARQEKSERKQNFENLGYVKNSQLRFSSSRVKSNMKSSEQLTNVKSSRGIQQIDNNYMKSFETQQSLEQQDEIKQNNNGEQTQMQNSLKQLQNQKYLVQKQFLELDKKEQQLIDIEKKSKSLEKIEQQQQQLQQLRQQQQQDQQRQQQQQQLLQQQKQQLQQNKSKELKIELSIGNNQKAFLIIYDNVQADIIVDQFIKKYNLNVNCHQQFKTIVQQFQSQYFKQTNKI